MRELKYNDSYKDEHTNAVLPQELNCKAIADELMYFCNHVLVDVPYEDAAADPQGHIVGGRWVLCNKQDASNPKCRGRYVAQEVNLGGEVNEAFDAATPPLECKRALFNSWAHERRRNGKAHTIQF